MSFGSHLCNSTGTLLIKYIRILRIHCKAYKNQSSLRVIHCTETDLAIVMSTGCLLIYLKAAKLN